MTTVKRLCSLSWLLCFPALIAGAQQPAAVPTAPLLSGGTPASFTYDVVATDGSGRPVTGLSAADFTLLDNKTPIVPIRFRAVDGATSQPPTEVVLVVDAVNAPYTTVAYERDQLERYLKRNNGQLALPTSLIFFEDANTRVQTSPTRDGNALVSTLESSITGLRSITRSQGYWGAADRLQLSVKTLGGLAHYEATRPGRKLLLWISPGWPLLTNIHTDLSRREEEGLFGNIVAMSAVLREARITLYAIDPLGMSDAGSLRLTYYEEFLKGVKKPEQVVPADLSLQVLAVQSGGSVSNSSNDIASLIANCAQEGLSYYELVFQPASGDGPNDYHAIQIDAKKPGIRLRTRTGYYAQPS